MRFIVNTSVFVFLTNNRMETSYLILSYFHLPPLSFIVVVPPFAAFIFDTKIPVLIYPNLC